MTGLAEFAGEFLVVEKLTVSTPVENVLLHSLNEEHDTGEAPGVVLGEDLEDLRLVEAGTEREVGERNVLGVDTLELENCGLVSINNCSVPPATLGPVILQDTQPLVDFSAEEPGDHVETIWNNGKYNSLNIWRSPSVKLSLNTKEKFQLLDFLSHN